MPRLEARDGLMLTSSITFSWLTPFVCELECHNVSGKRRDAYSIPTSRSALLVEFVGGLLQGAFHERLEDVVVELRSADRALLAVSTGVGVDMDGLLRDKIDHLDDNVERVVRRLCLYAISGKAVLAGCDVAYGAVYEVRGTGRLRKLQLEVRGEVRISLHPVHRGDHQRAVKAGKYFAVAS